MSDFRLSSDLATPRERVWEHVVTPRGVNAELRPLRMTFPATSGSIDQLPLGRDLFCSRIRLWGWLPVDWHWLGLDEIVPGRGFRERSRSVWLAEWRHERTLDDIPGGCRLTDHIAWRARLPGASKLLGPLYRAIFRRRHRRLRATFGTCATTSGSN